MDYNYTKLSSLVTSDKFINIFALVKDFACLHIESNIFYHMRLVDETLSNGETISCLLKLAKVSNFEGFISSHMIIRIHRCQCKSVSNNQLQIYGTLGQICHAIGFSVALSDDLKQPKFFTSLNYNFTSRDKFRVDELCNFSRRSFQKKCIQFHAESFNFSDKGVLLFHETAAQTKEDCQISNKDLLPIATSDDISFEIADTHKKDDHIQQASNGVVLDTDICIEVENVEPMTIDEDRNVIPVRNYLAKLTKEIDLFYKFEKGAIKFSEIPPNMSKDDSRRYFDVVCQVISVYSPPDGNLFLIMVSDGSKIHTDLPPFYPLEHCANNKNIFGKQDLFSIGSFIYTISCFEEYAAEARRIAEPGNFVRISNVRFSEHAFKNQQQTFTLSLHGKSWRKCAAKRGINLLSKKEDVIFAEN